MSGHTATPCCNSHADLVKALEEIFEVGDGYRLNTHEKSAGTTGEGHSRCRGIAAAALATLTARKVG